MILYYDWCKPNVLSIGTFIFCPWTNRLKTFAGQWRHEKFSEDVRDPQCRESNWITQTLKRWWIVNVRSLFKKIAPQEKNTHNDDVYDLTLLETNRSCLKICHPKNETSLPTINFQVPNPLVSGNADCNCQMWCIFWHLAPAMVQHLDVKIFSWKAHISHDIFLKTPRDLAVLGFGT